MENPLLYDLYNEIRTDKQWISPGLEEYYLIHDLMKSKDFEIKTFDDFVFVLETAWLKSHNQREKFRKLLETRRNWLNDLYKFMQTTKPETDDAEKKLNSEKAKLNDQTTNDQSPEDITNTQTSLPGLSDKKNTEGEVQKNEPQDKTEVENDTMFTMEEGDIMNSQTLEFGTKDVKDKPLVEIPYLFTDDYFPVKNRQLQQAWRTLKSRKESGNSTELDILKTIEYTARQGYFSSFIYEKKIINQVQLFIFIDQSESMLAMETFGKELCDTARAGELHSELKPCFFYKVPRRDEKKNDYIFSNKNGTKINNLKNIFFKLNKKDIVVLIYSDAGALKHEIDETRLNQTIKFIRHLHNQTGYVAWVNPAPKSRWTETNAALISEEIPMFETNRIDIENAIAVLKGKLTIK